VSGNRFFLSPDIFNQAEIVFPVAVSRQIYSVLRLKAGETVTILDNRGASRPVELRELDSRQVTGVAGHIQQAQGEPSVELTLCPALTQREKFEWILQKGTELGVKHFVPLVTSRSLVQETGSREEKMTRWQKILQEAAEQCGRGLIPDITAPLKLADFLNRSDQLRGYILYEREKQASLADSLIKQFSGGNRQTVIIVGPEGGFSSDEAARISLAGHIPVSLGTRILRMETAAVTACVICMTVAGELGSFAIHR
jgi:16S rRNA (uracil1498-N3)-methyltransferase